MFDIKRPVHLMWGYRKATFAKLTLILAAYIQSQKFLLAFRMTPLCHCQFWQPLRKLCFLISYMLKEQDSLTLQFDQYFSIQIGNVYSMYYAWSNLVMINVIHRKEDCNNNFGNFRQHLHNLEESSEWVITFRRKRVCQ